LLAIPSLGEDLAENLISHIFGRVKVSTFYPEDLLEMAITCAEETVKCFVQNGGNFIGVLIQVFLPAPKKSIFLGLAKIT
jgi:hypothetical protein